MPRRRTEAEKQEGRRKSERERAGKNRAKAREAGVPTPAQIDRGALDLLLKRQQKLDAKSGLDLQPALEEAVRRHLGIDAENEAALKAIRRRIRDR